MLFKWQVTCIRSMKGDRCFTVSKTDCKVLEIHSTMEAGNHMVFAEYLVSYSRFEEEKHE